MDRGKSCHQVVRGIFIPASDGAAFIRQDRITCGDAHLEPISYHSKNDRRNDPVLALLLLLDGYQ